MPSLHQVKFSDSGVVVDLVAAAQEAAANKLPLKISVMGHELTAIGFGMNASQPNLMIWQHLDGWASEWVSEQSGAYLSRDKSLDVMSLPPANIRSPKPACR